MSNPIHHDKNLPNHNKNKLKSDIKFSPPPIPQKLVKENILNSDEISDVDKILNLNKIDSTKCCNLVQKLNGYYGTQNTANRFLFYLTYGIISFLSKMKSENDKRKYLTPYKTLIQRIDVQLIIFTKPDILYQFYAIIFNSIESQDFVDVFNTELRNLNKSIRPDKEVFWKKFYNFLICNTKTKNPPKVQPNSILTTFMGDKYLINISEKLLFFSYIGLKSFARPKDFSYFYELIFLCIINYQLKPTFYPVLMKADPIESIDYLILYINQNINSERYEKFIMKKNNLKDPNFSTNISNIFYAIGKDNKYPVPEYLYKLAKACIPLISNQKIFNLNDDSDEFDSLLIYFIKLLYEDARINFFYYLLGCSKKPQKDLLRKRFKFDPSLCPPIEKGILFFKNSGMVSLSFIIKFIYILLSEINIIELDRLQLIIQTCLEIGDNDQEKFENKEGFLSLLNQFQNNQHWALKYKKTIQDKKKAKAGQELDTYLKNLQEQASISPQKVEIELPLDIEINDSSGNVVTYNLLFVNPKKSSEEPRKFSVTFDGSVTVKKAISRIAKIGINEKDEEDTKQEQNNENNNDGNNENKNEETTNSNLNDDEVEEIDPDDDDNDAFYHTMKLGRDSHFCKDGTLFGHQRTLADRSSRESAEIFGLSNYVDRSIPFNSIGFPNNTLYIRLVPANKLKIDSYMAKRHKPILLKPSIVDEKQPEVIPDVIVLPKIDDDDETIFDSLTSTDMSLIYKILGHPPSSKEAKLYLDLGRDINKFRESIITSELQKK